MPCRQSWAERDPGPSVSASQPLGAGFLLCPSCLPVLSHGCDFPGPPQDALPSMSPAHFLVLVSSSPFVYLALLSLGLESMVLGLAAVLPGT